MTFCLPQSPVKTLTKEDGQVLKYTVVQRPQPQHDRRPSAATTPPSAAPLDTIGGMVTSSGVWPNR